MTDNTGLDLKAIASAKAAFVAKSPRNEYPFPGAIEAAIRAYLAASASVASDTAEDAADIEAAQLALQEYREKGGTSLADIKAELARDTAALPSGYEGLVEALAFKFQGIMSEHLSVDTSDGEIIGVGQSSFAMAREAISALGRAPTEDEADIAFRALANAKRFKGE